MRQLVVTFHPNGTVETLLKDTVLDTRIFGRREIKRVSEVLPTDDGEEFFIRWLRGPKAGEVERHEDGTTAFFHTYEAAVDQEIAAVNAMRLAGHSFA